MDKNKNRTDLLAAGRKKLQQYRQKKDGKGSKSSGKANKPESDVVADEASSVAKPTKGKKQLPAEVSVQDSATELVDSSNVDAATIDPSSTSDLAIEVSEADMSTNDSVPDESLQSSNLDDAMPSVSSPKTVDIEGKPESSYVPVTPVGLKAVLQDSFARKVGELKAASGEDQVPDVGAMQEHDHSCSEPDNRTISIDPESDDRGQVDSGLVKEDTKMEYTSSTTEQTSEYDDSGTNNADLNSSSGVPSFDPEPTFQQKENVTVGFHGNEGIKLPSTSGDSEVIPEVIPVSLTQLAKASQFLGEDEIRCVMAARGFVSDGDLKNDGSMKSESVEFSERLREQLYINNLEKELTHLQLCEERDARKEFDNEKSSISDSLGDVEGTNKILSEELAKCRSELDRVTHEMEKLQMDFSFSRTELERSSIRIEELQIELKRSEHHLSDVSSELVDSRSLLSDLQAKNENLNVNVSSLTEEKHKLEKEKGDGILENERLMKELMECKSLLESLQAKNENLNVNVSSLTEEKHKLEKEKGDGILENERLMKELMECKSLLESSQVENVNTKESLALVMEERAKLENEKEKYVSELVESKKSVEALQLENASLNEQLVQENKNFSMELLESQQLVESLRAESAKLSESLDLVTRERTGLREEVSYMIAEKEVALTELTNCKTSMNDLQVEYEKSMTHLKDRAQQLENLANENVTLTNTLDTYKAKIKELDDCKTKSVEDKSQHLFDVSSGFVALKKQLTEIENVIQEIEKAIVGMYSESAVSSGVPKLVKNFESEGHNDEFKEIPVFTEDSEPLVTVKKNIDILKDMFRGLVLDAENARELFKVQKSGKISSDSKLEELMVPIEAMKDQSNSLEEMFFQHVVLDEVVKQYVSIVEANKAELVAMCEELNQEVNFNKMKNSDLTEKLCTSESRIGELQSQVDELQQHADHMASLNNQLETLHRKLDASIGSISDTHSSETDAGQSISTRMATSVDQVVAVIQDLQANHNLLFDSCKEMTEKTKDLEGRNGLASYVIHKVFDNLQKIVNDSGPASQESEVDATSEQLDHLEISNYDVFIERLIMILHERAQLESKNREYNLELLRRIKDMEELNKRCISPDVIVKLFEDIQCSVTLDDIEIKPDEPVSSLESVIHFLIKNLNYKETKSIDLQNEIDHLTFSSFQCEIEAHVLKGSLISSMEQLGALKSETQLKETELHHSEQRVSALREKLHIAVTKGKGLIQQRDSLKQNLTATSNELEKCLHELQLKDAALQETETKLKTYSEAGERMEALESELSYIRNSATALRESFLLKDSVLQRIEEILEDLELPEDFHVRDIIDKIDWLAKSISQSQNSFPVTTSNQMITIERTRSYPDSGSRVIDGWREDLEPTPSPDDELRRNYEELQNKFYGLAEQNEMLEQSLMERNKLVQRWEEVLDKINMPPQFRSLEPEDRIEWLRSALLEANDRCDLLQQDIHDLEKVRESLAADLEESQRRLVDLESALKSITDDREQLFASLEAQTHDFNRISEQAALHETEKDKLQHEVGKLQLKLDEKRVDGEHIHGEIKRLQDIVKDMLQVPETEDVDSNTSDIQCLEGLLRKLADKNITETSVLTHEERSVDQSDTHGDLQGKLEEAEGELVLVKDERDRHVETIQSLVQEVKSLELKNHELQNLYVQEEQKCAAVKEKLNVAVRKGKSLVQVRDGMKQMINDLTSQVERLTSEIKVRENTILEFQQKMKDFFTSQEMVENKDSEIRFLKSRLEESDSELQDKRNTLSMILGALTEINLGVELRTNDPVEKLKEIENVIQDLQFAMSSAEQDSRKSKRAAELLLAEVNEVQERNEDLLEEISELSKQRDSAEAAKRESLSNLEQLSAIHLEERSKQLSELMNLKSGFDKLRPGFSKIYNLLNDLLPNDLDSLYNLEAGVKSLLESSDTSNVSGQSLNSSRGGISSWSESKVNFHWKSFFDSKTEELQNDNKIIDLWRFVGTLMQDLIIDINAFEEKLQSHSNSLHEEITLLSETVAILGREITSYKYSLDSAKEEIVWLESNSKQKETENLMLRKYVSKLYEACKNSVLEIEKSKDDLVADDSSGEDILSGETLSVSEERITSMVNRLLSLVKDFHSFQAESMEVNLKEMKATISSLQKELTEKDVQKDRISVELVSQIKRAETAAMSHLQELESAKVQIIDLKGQCNVLEQRVKELEGQETVLVDLHGKVKSLTETLTAKEQENEALLQALDEEEAQMEDLTNKITESERLLQQKNLDLESAEAARGKALKKLSITVSKFDELHRLSETLVSEVDNLQSQLQERDSEISFLRDEITRCTSDSLQALETDKRGLDEVQDILTWLDSMVSGVETRDMHLDENKTTQVLEYKEILKQQITSIISELKDLRHVAQSKDDLLHKERSKVDDLMRRSELLEKSLREKESRLSLHENNDDSAPRTSMTSEIVEVEPLINKWSPQGTSMAPQVRSLRKVNNEQLAISIDDMDSDERDKLEDDDDDKAHGFKSLTTSKLVPRFTRPVTDFIDGLWVSCDRTLMRQPVLRLSLIIYWAVMHALLAVFVV